MAARLLSALAILLVAVFSNATPVPNTDTLKWGRCPTSIFTEQSRLECAYISVPMDWDNPQSAGTVTLGIARLPARDPKRRIGSLFYNPGGPGDQATATLGLIATSPLGVGIHTDILDRFDLIGVDLRGSGLSDPLKCDPDIFDAGYRLPLYPQDEPAFEQLVQHNRAFRRSCLKMTGSPLFDYMDTKSIAKDHEAVRNALGGEKISWLGQSYGTQLGSQYAELFPDSFRAMILDCSVSLSPPETALFAEGAASVEATFRYFIEWCEKQNATTCPLAHQNQTVEAIWRQLLERADQSPIPMPYCQINGVECAFSRANADQIIEGTQSQLYKPSINFVPLASGIYNASFQNDASAFQVNSSKHTPPYYTYTYAQIAISCNDEYHNATSYVDMHYKQFIGESEAPLMRGYSPYLAFQRDCAGLPPPSRNPPHVIDIPHIDSFPTVLMLANVYDPATPMAGSVNLRQEIGKERAVLATRVAAGHTIYFQPDAFNGKAVHAMNKYLLDLEVPEQGVVYRS